MKKKIALILSLIILVTLAIPVGVFADGFDKGLENAIKIAKTKFTIPESYKFETSISTEDSKKIFRLSWRSETENEENFNVAIDENGTIINYDHYKSSDYTDQKKLPKYSKSDAKTSADKFLANVAPGLAAKLRYEETYNNNISDSTYNLTYIRIENGIPLYNDQVSLNINRNNGEVTNYYLRWTDGLSFVDPSKAITAAKAQQEYISKLGLRLIYKYSYENSKVTVYPVYVTKYNNNFAIDALTGQKIEINNSYYGPYYTGAADKMNVMFSESAKAESPVLTPEEQNAVKDAGKIISIEKAESYARALKYINLNGYKLNYSNLSKNWPLNDNLSWYMSFSKAATKTSSGSYASVTVDAVSGKVKNFYGDRKYVEGEKGKISIADAKTAVDKFLKEFRPDLYSQLVYDDVYNTDYSKQTDKPAVYNLTYVRKAGNVLFPDNTVTVSYDAVNNKVVSFDLNWFNISFPSVDKAIKPDAAYKTLFESIGLELQYSLKYEENTNSQLENIKRAAGVPQSTKPKAVLVYTLKPNKPVNIDANTSGLLDYSGKPYKENKTASYTDISGNAAENEIKVLAEYGISLEGKEFKPAEAIIQKDFFILLSKSMGNYDINPASNETDKAINDMYNSLIRSGIVKASEKSINAKVTREDAVKFIIRALKYDKVADLKDMFNCSFMDKSSITPELIGYVTMAGNLKLIEYGNINFAPKTEMTRAETAVLIYKYLQL